MYESNLYKRIDVKIFKYESYLIHNYIVPVIIDHFGNFNQI